jgi:hypothetical protein
LSLAFVTLFQNLFCRFLAGARHQELGLTKQQFFIEGLCTSMTQVIPVMALALYISCNVEVHLEAYQVCGFVQQKVKKKK